MLSHNNIRTSSLKNAGVQIVFQAIRAKLGAVAQHGKLGD
jgi:hypothetical protein